MFTNGATLTVNSLPVITFAEDPIPVCGVESKVLTPIISGGSGTWNQHTWTGDVGPLDNYFIQSPTFKSTIAGPYNLNYKVRDSNLCYGSGDVTVNVDSPDASFTQDMTLMCSPDTVTFTKDMTGIASFTWNFGDGSPVNTVDDNPVHIFTNSNPSTIGFYNVSLTVVSPGGCQATQTILITVYPAIDATFTASRDTICSGQVITFTANPYASSYFWDYGDGISGPGTSMQEHLFTNPGALPIVRTVNLKTMSPYGCMDEKTLDITVMPVPAAQFTAAPTPQVFDPAGNTVTFTNQTPNPGSFTYTWAFGDGNTSIDTSPVYTYSNGVGTYDVILVATNGICTSTVTHQVSIVPPSPVADFDSLPSGCEPLTLVINNTSLNTDIPGTTYRWEFGDGSISTAKNPTYTYFDAGAYRVDLTVTGPGGTSGKSQMVYSYASPKAYFEVSPTKVFVNDEKVRCFNLSEGASYYLWDFGDGDTSKVAEPYHKYMEEGIYDITLWAYSANGCSDKYLLSPGVTVDPAGVIRFATVFTPNKDGEVDIDHLPTGGPEYDMFFFPPIMDKVEKYKLQIFNRWGVLIFETRDPDKPWNGYYQHKLCPQGVYVWFVEGKYANGQPFKQVGDITLLH